MANPLNINEIMGILPHRHPFLLIDKVEDHVPGEYCIAYKNFTYDEYFFKGHFPDMPIVPGVITLEALAQTGAVAILSMDEFKGKVAAITAVDRCKFKVSIVPGDTVRLEAKITAVRGNAGMGEACATVDGKVCVVTEFKFAVLEN